MINNESLKVEEFKEELRFRMVYFWIENDDN